MTQPTPEWSPPSEAEFKRFLERGSTTKVKVEKTLPSPSVSLSTLDPIEVDIPGSEGFAGHIKGGGGNRDAHVTLSFTYTEQPEFVAHIFVDTPGATADTPIAEPGFVGAVAFFWHHEGQATMRFRLPATVAVAAKKRSSSSTITVVPVGYPGQQPQAHTVEITAALEVVESTVTRNK
jgi:hypothetical protein